MCHQSSIHKESLCSMVQTLRCSFHRSHIVYHAASLSVHMDLGRVQQESEHRPPEWDPKWSDYVIDRNIFIFRPVFSGGKLQLLSYWVGSQLVSQNINPQGQISCSELSWLLSSNLSTGGHFQSGSELQGWLPGEGADQSLTRAMAKS